MGGRRSDMAPRGDRPAARPGGRDESARASKAESALLFRTRLVTLKSLEMNTKGCTTRGRHNGKPARIAPSHDSLWWWRPLVDGI